MASVDNSLCKTSSEFIKQLFNRLYNYHRDLADVYFILGNDEDQQRIPAHKLFLALKSEVFKTMFYGSLPESNEIPTHDIELEAFLILLNFLYFNEVAFGSTQIAVDTLNASKKYMVPELENHCVEFLKKALNSKNACFLLTQARLYNKPDLVDACLNVIDKNTMEALETDYFTNIDLETLILILKRDTLEVFEIQLFDAILKWSKAECVRRQLSLSPENQRSVLDKAIDFIHFYFMTIKEFTTGPIQSEMLQYDEIKLYSLDIVSNGNSTARPRCCKDCFESRIKFNSAEKSTHNFNYFKWQDYSHHFKIKKSTYIIGFIVNKSPEVDTKLEIKKNNKKITGNYLSSLYTLTCMFNELIMLTEDEEFQIIYSFKSKAAGRGTYNINSSSKWGSIEQCGEEKRMDNWFEWGPNQVTNFIQEIIFYN